MPIQSMETWAGFQILCCLPRMRYRGVDQGEVSLGGTKPSHIGVVLTKLPVLLIPSPLFMHSAAHAIKVLLHGKHGATYV